VNYTQLVDAIVAYTENVSDDFAAQIPVFVQQAEQRIYNSVQFPSLRKNVTGQTTASNKYLSCPGDFLSVYSMAVITDVTGVDLNTGTYEYLLNKDVNFIRQSYPSPNDVGVPRYYALFGPTTSGSSITNELSFILGPTPNSSYYVELHYYYYPMSIVQGVINTLGTVTGGSGYTNGTYENVALTGGSGSAAYATITVAGGTVTTVTLASGGQYYVVGDTLSASLSGGTNFSVPVSAVNNSSGTSWLGDNFDTVLLYGSLVEAYTYMKGEQDMMNLYNQKYMEALQLAKRLGDGLERSDVYRSGQSRLPPLPQNNGVR
jgi:hypothetical protein